MIEKLWYVSSTPEGVPCKQDRNTLDEAPLSATYRHSRAFRIDTGRAIIQSTAEEEIVVRMSRLALVSRNSARLGVLRRCAAANIATKRIHRYRPMKEAKRKVIHQAWKAVGRACPFV